MEELHLILIFNIDYYLTMDSTTASKKKEDNNQDQEVQIRRSHGNAHKEIDRQKEGNGMGEKQEHKKQGLTHLTVKTKKEDGGSQTTVTESNESDAFSRYSNTNVRMMHLLGIDDDESVNGDNLDWQRLTGYQGGRNLKEGAGQDENERKTKLSTELHYNVFDSWN